MMYVILAVAGIWYAVGFVSFVYWHTKKHDFTIGELPTCMIAGIIGPIAYFIGFSIFNEDKVLIKKRI